MKNPIWIVALLLATAFSAVSRGDDCDCPCARTKKAREPQTSKESKDKRVASHPIAGGKTAVQAVPIEFERVYKINHPLKKGMRGYFSLPLEPGTELTLAMKSLKKADVGLEVLDPKDQTAATLALSGEVNEVKRISWKPLKTGRYPIAIGGSQGDIGANLVIFEATLAPATIECAADGEEPTPISPDAPREDCFWEQDAKDVFHFEGKKKDVYRIEIVTSESTSGLQATVGLAQKKKNPKILADVSGSGGRVAIESVALPEKGTYSLEVGLAQPSLDILPYTVTFTKISAQK